MTAGDRDQWRRWVVWLSWGTIVYNILEGGISIAFGLSDESIALFGFGVDSFVEVGSACLVLWRFRAETEAGSEMGGARERAATRAIGWLFLALAITTAIGACYELAAARHPETTLPGVIVSTLSLGFMFFLWGAKGRAAKALDSSTVAKDAACSLACIKLSAVLLAGSILFLAAPMLWWADAAAALLLSALIAREGWETVEASRKPNFTGGCGCDHD